jgi:uncharacterized protein (TIGR03437 family)
VVPSAPAPGQFTTEVGTKPEPFTVSPATPAITTLSPNAATVGSASLNLAVSGSQFVAGATVLWNGAGLVTTFWNSTQLMATVPASFLQSVGTAAITVSNGANVVSAPQTFTINPPAPSLTALSPASAVAGGGDFMLMVSVANCTTGTVVQWNGTALPTTFVSPSQLTAAVSASLIAIAGTVTVRLAGAGTLSNPAQFTILPAPPAIFSLSPNPAPATASALTLTVSGSNFAAGATVLWNGGALPTSVVSASQLTATVPPSLLSAGPSASIVVANPGGLASAAVVLTIDSGGPLIRTLSPPSATAGGPAFTLMVTGANFTAGCTVTWNGTALPTTFLSANQVSADVSADAIAVGGTVAIALANSTGALSGTVSFPVNASLPAISGVSPASVFAGSPAFTLSVTGTGFLHNSLVLWNGSPLATKMAGATLTAAVPASLVAAVGTAVVTVGNGDQVSSPVAFPIVAPVPAVSSGGIVNAASGLASIAPGSLISIYGANLAAANLSAPSTPLPTSLNGTSVIINAVAAPLVFVSPTQINAQVPFETQAGTAKLVIQALTFKSDPVSLEIVAAAPGVVIAAGSNHAVAQNWPGGSVNSSSAPASPGQYVTIYLTGQGQVDPPVATGAATPDSPPSIPVAPVAVRVGGKDAVVDFAGLVPEAVGLMQINLTIPAVPAGDQLLEVSIGGVAANQTFLSVAAASSTPAAAR